VQTPIQPVRVISRAHDAPTHVCKIDPTSTYLASGSADGVVKVWNFQQGYVTHVFKGHGGVVSALAFSYPQDVSSVGREQTMRLITASVDTRIRIFNLSSTSSSRNSGKPEAVLEGHVSVPRGLDISRDGKWLISGGRDSVVMIWNLCSKEQSSKSSSKASFSPVLAKTIPVLERVEALGLLHHNEDKDASTTNGIRFYTGGEKGIVKVWDGEHGKVLFTLGQEQNSISDDQEAQRQILDILWVFFPSCFLIIIVLTSLSGMCHLSLLLSRFTQTKILPFTRFQPNL
jgi:U3 small nucleolar RNA-associated protein 13